MTVIDCDALALIEESVVSWQYLEPESYRFRPIPDYPHGDAFRQDLLAQGLKEQAGVGDALVEKVLSDNPGRLFHF